MIRHRLATLFALVLGLSLMFEWPAVRATDVGSAEYTKPIDDLILQIGNRRLHLPPGHWYFTARRVGPTYGGGKNSGYGYLGAAALIENGVHLESVAFAAPTRDLRFIYPWPPSACEVSAPIFSIDLTQPGTGPECVSIFRVENPQVAYPPINEQVGAWQKQMYQPWSSLLHIIYTQARTSTYGRLSVFAPPEAFQTEQEAAQWAAALPAIIGPLFEGLTHDAQLPALPVHVPTAASATAN